jgi:hypothetical protein
VPRLWTVYSGICLTTKEKARKTSVRVGQSSWKTWHFEDGTDSSYRNVGNYQSPKHNITEQQRYQLHRGGNQNTRTHYVTFSQLWVGLSRKPLKAAFKVSPEPKRNAWNVDCVWNVMAHAQKPDFVFQRNGRVHLNRQGRLFSPLLPAEVRASAVAPLDTPCSEVVWRVPSTHSIHQFPLHFPSRASPCAITFQLDSIVNPPCNWCTICRWTENRWFIFRLLFIAILRCSLNMVINSWNM